MDDYCWEIFKLTGSIDAYLYINQKNLCKDRDKLREIKEDDNSFGHPGDCT